MTAPLHHKKNPSLFIPVNVAQWCVIQKNFLHYLINAQCTCSLSHSSPGACAPEISAARALQLPSANEDGDKIDQLCCSSRRFKRCLWTELFKFWQWDKSFHRGCDAPTYNCFFHSFMSKGRSLCGPVCILWRCHFCGLTTISNRAQRLQHVLGAWWTRARLQMNSEVALLTA